MQVTITEAARRLGVSEKTARRRVHNGDLAGTQVPTPQGFTWMVDLPEDEVGESDQSSNNGVPNDLLEVLRDSMKRQDETIELLRHELETRGQEVQQLHVLVQQAQAALPAPKENHQSWWRFWGK